MGCFLVSLPETFKKCQKTCIVNAKNEKKIAFPVQKIKKICIPNAK